MIIKDCIKYASEILHMTEVSKKLGGEAVVLSDAASTELADLILCAHGVVREVASAYAQAICTESVIAQNGEILFRELSQYAIGILSIEQGEKQLSFTRIYGGVNVGVDGPCTITYAYLPFVDSIDSTVMFDNPKIDARTLGMGIAAEYSMREGMTDEAVLWDSRYKDALKDARRYDGRERRVKPRRWL